jgi:hypothetical protein
MPSREEYIQRAVDLSSKAKKSGLFGDIWWYSLIHEKNVYRSMSYHDYCKGISSIPVSEVRTVLGGIAKLVRMVARWIVYARPGKVKVWPVYDIGRIIVGYDPVKVFAADGGYSFIHPRRRDWGRCQLSKKMEYVDSLLFGLADLRWIILAYFENLFLFRKRLIWFVSNTGSYWYCLFLDDFRRSFLGDILVEGLFYERIFANLFWFFPVLDAVIYTYEGLAWEKALCIQARNMGVTTIGAKFGKVSGNVLEFYYTEEEKRIMPYPNTLREVIWPKPNVKVNALAERILIVLSTLPAINYEMLGFLKRAKIPDLLMVKNHPDDNTDYFRSYRDMNAIFLNQGRALDLVWMAKAIVAFDSSVITDLVGIGIPIFVPTLPAFADLNPEPESVIYVRTPEELRKGIEKLG